MMDYDAWRSLLICLYPVSYRTMSGAVPRRGARIAGAAAREIQNRILRPDCSCQRESDGCSVGVRAPV